MQKFNLVISKEKQEALLAYFQERGDVEIVNLQSEKKEKEGEHQIDPVRKLGGGRSSIARVNVATQPQRVTREVSNGVDLALAELAFVLDLLKEKVPEEKSGLATKLKRMVNPQVMTLAAFEEHARKFNYQEVIRRAKEADNALVQLATEERESTEQLKVLEPWESLGLTGADFATQSTLSILGAISEQGLANLKKVVDGEVNVRKVSTRGGSYYIVITYLKKREEKFLKALSTTGFSEVHLPCINTPHEAIIKITKRLAEIQKEKKKILKGIKKLSREHRKLKMVYDYLANRKKVKDAQKSAENTIYMSVLSGWTSQAVFKKLKKILPQKFPGIYLEAAKPAKGESVPVVIANKSLVEPFETVTRIYGMPAYKALDPTPYLSIFFAVFFGMCLSDAGYGAILLTLSIVALKFFHPSQNLRRLAKLIIYCSITTIIVGVLYGSYFGITPMEIPSFLGPLFSRAQLIDPVKSPLKIMIIALIMGLLQSWFARMVNVKYLLSQRKIKDALLGDFIWVLAIGAIVFWGVTKFFLPSLAKAGLYVVVGAAALLVLTQGHQKKNIFLKFGKGLLSLYGAVGILADVLSYSRLLALGLTTSIIAIVVNVVAVLFRDMIPYFGWVVMILILLAGHTFNMGINILGGFIHSARLQYVEFFPKFLEGSGRDFKPLKKEYKFTKIKSEIGS